MNTRKVRDAAIDVTRSIAIFLMVAANMAVIAHGESPWWFRLSSSLAAPMFISIASMMVALGFARNKGVIPAFIKCIFLFLIAGLLDFSNATFPFLNIDVLYLIGILLIIVSVIGRLPNSILIVLITAILFITPLLQNKFGYQAEMLVELNPKNLDLYTTTFLTEAIHRYLIDGWFPLFPWMSLGLFGAILGKLRYHTTGMVSFAKIRYVISALMLIASGIFVWWLFPNNQLSRYDYIELFYPPAPGFMLFSMGIIICMICLVDYASQLSLWSLFYPLGEAPLFMYLFHIALIEHLILPLGSITFGIRYFIYYLALISIMMTIGVLLRNTRRKLFYQKSPQIIKWVFG
jgi:hypothetical protein